MRKRSAAHERPRLFLSEDSTGTTLQMETECSAFHAEERPVMGRTEARQLRMMHYDFLKLRHSATGRIPCRTFGEWSALTDFGSRSGATMPQSFRNL